MADEGLNLHPAASAALLSRERRGRDDGAVHRYRRAIVIGSLVCGDLVAGLVAIKCSRLLIDTCGLRSPPPPRLTALILILAFSLLGLYSGSGPGPYERFRQRTIGILGFTAIWCMAATPEQNILDFLVAQLASAAFLLTIGDCCESVIRNQLIYSGLWGAPTVLVGSADDCRALAELLLRKPDLGMKPIGLIKAADPGNPEGDPFPVPILGRTTELASFRLWTETEVAIFASKRELAAVQLECAGIAPSCRLMLIEDVRAIQGPWVRARTIDTMIGIEVRRNLGSWQSLLIKRTLDLLVSIPIALLTLPLLGVAALMIKLIDPGPAFFVQKRIGRNGAVVKVLKLRTMYLDSERLLEDHLLRDAQARVEWQRYFKLRYDPRILPIVGNFLRRSSVDELPQLWNVICGQMSLVGPRPLPAYHAEQFDEEFRLLRVGVLPGITGLWQVSSRSDGDLGVLREQDLFYIRNWSLWLDFYILLRTVPAILAAKGAR